ncbi:FadR/GntR family transcriptional regulator [Lysinibacillus sp. FSL M8-0216]|uniref:FadR/GntR family transcriptional regulator n=1 Tax=Lysinibacillus TaxID=400634 RepID=UPI0008812976|nr:MULTISPECIES: FadR/GntR family transcriptional regulator [Lysinibacillus]MED4671135.1 FadR/GntR family transcriptional regulator [Lysinibacillus fusiformis]QAS55393.1 FadR family transcriptional regulator [Lysinibacillus sphaericus]RDV33613.1 FadR family transcriptional regulator [Lysinibacillus fusiformis]SCX46025.1 transcriptional regulator, GntR family [Lysinibacillus fusiformis]SDB16228.1 transcriptional regulator, GntR family [Lysinibacillus fusiformis]
MELRKIKPKKIYEEVSEILHEKIRAGVLKPGDRLDSVEQLAEQLQVSRSAVREALSALKAMGLIEIKQGSGTFVKSVPPNRLDFPLSTAMLSNKLDIARLLEVRKIIEVGAAASAAINRTEQDIQAMVQILEDMKQAHGDGELGEKVDYQFHVAIATASQNPLLATILDQISGLMIDTMKETRRIWLYSKKTTSEQLYEEHMNIFLAIQQQNEELAKQAMTFHLSNVEKVLLQYFETTDSHPL